MSEINGIPVNEMVVPCRFSVDRCCSGVAVGRYATPNGCVCYREDTEQDLCVQHAITAEPLGPFRLIVIYQPELYQTLIEMVG